ncbi:7 alpha-cephem-methoxylase, putative [Beauveria bassiana ARSEF 2860]|uniref:7 alpha-cephem-methoxylase, putative n=1 Tax=Beauveria bassiana (strain ARSEF 2860) TaxID=655819 RepID=J4UVB0_BEAB2|nr:7 alpha-cephem-methoxylase, putative [Beauveria bassiana ARSEF 2860]EJP70062.1 7 alpha-cephem-methoxylase, putative [Beauveria bassiana ARSEF 2860]
MTVVLGQFNYFQWQKKFEEEKPYYLYTDPPPGYPNANFATQPGAPEPIQDVRGREHEFSLDDNGFAFCRQNYPHKLRDVDENTIKEQYLPSLEVLIRDLLQEECEIFWFDWRRRSSDDGKSKFSDGTVVNLENRQLTLAPIKAVHVDQTPAAAIDRVYRHVPEKADELLKKRFRIINVWRPIGNPVESMPLAFMDGSQVPQDKLIEVDVVRRSFPGESFYPLEHGGYKWYFMNQQAQDEVLFMKMTDSKEDVKAKCCPHASFAQMACEGARPRESIEARALVFTDW